MECVRAVEMGRARASWLSELEPPVKLAELALTAEAASNAKEQRLHERVLPGAESRPDPRADLPCSPQTGELCPACAKCSSYCLFTVKILLLSLCKAPG